MSALDEVGAVVADGPGLTVVELRDLLRAQGRVSITAADVATVLRANPGRFRADGSEPERWWPSNGDRTRPTPTDRLPPLHAWQAEALEAWHRRGRRGVIEAVTGTGKTMVGIAAAAQELALGGQVCVLVPTAELLRQWAEALGRHLRPGAGIGLLGAGHHDRMGDHDVLVAVINSARAGDLRPRRPGGLLVGDECHRYGTDVNSAALEPGFPRRLGLSATFARTDDGHLAWLRPYFGRTCFRMGYRRAIADGVAAHFVVALIGVEFDPDERATYHELSLQLTQGRAVLIARFGVPAEPIGVFLRTVANLARGDGDSPAGIAARAYLSAMADRRRLLAETPAKAAALARLVPAVRAAERSIVFTQTIQSAERAASAMRDGGLGAAAIHSGLDAGARLSVLADFRDGPLRVITAPQVLDEGVDVPAADLAVILACSRSRRQMVQRMGRVLRPKPDGRRARFIVVHVEGTVEDPAYGAHEGFLEEVTSVADGVRRFRSESDADAVCAFLSASIT